MTQASVLRPTKRASEASGIPLSVPGRPMLGKGQLAAQFPPRPVTATWPATEQPRHEIETRLLAPPFGWHAKEIPARGFRALLDFLAAQPGGTWQERWQASGAEELCITWRDPVLAWLKQHQGLEPTICLRTNLGSGMLALLSGDVIRPSPQWLLTRSTYGALAKCFAVTRDPEGFKQLAQVADIDKAMSADARSYTYSRVAIIMAGKGGSVRDITVGDCLELSDDQNRIRSYLGRGAHYVYRLMHSAGMFPANAPESVRAFKAVGQLTPEQLIDRYSISCKPVRDLLVSYLCERQPKVDYNTLNMIASTIGRLFWKDLEQHHPGIDSIDLPRDVALAWMQRLTKLTKTVTAADGEKVEVTKDRLDAPPRLWAVRAFYLDISHWAMEEPQRWAQWAVPCPIREADLPDSRKFKSRQKSRMDQRTRERLPTLLVLAESIGRWRDTTKARLEAGLAAERGSVFTVNGETFRRPKLTSRTRGQLCVFDSDGQRRFLEVEENYGFWAWATVEVLRHTGIRIEELLELSHHSFVQYRLPDTGELVPLLQIAPSKTDQERLVLISPELADVLSSIVHRVRGADGAVPIVTAFDIYERVWNPPLPLLFQRKLHGENRAIPRNSLGKALDAAIEQTGLTDNTGQGLRFTPHDFRRLFVTDAVMSGLPPHIAQVICGHRDINTTMGYKAIYPEEAIAAHRAFLARRRGTRPSEEYRTPTPEEWEAFLGTFQKRTVALGTCARAFGTPCIHEHACIRCSLLWPDPDQRPRLAQIQQNLLDRLTEAENEGWHGEVEGLKTHIAGANAKLAQMDDLASRCKTRRGVPDVSAVVSITIQSRPPQQNPAGRP